MLRLCQMIITRVTSSNPKCKKKEIAVLFSILYKNYSRKSRPDYPRSQFSKCLPNLPGNFLSGYRLLKEKESIVFITGVELGAGQRFFQVSL